MHRSGNSWQLAGSLDADGGYALLREIQRGQADVHIDGSRLQRIDGAGLTALAVARQRCRAEGRAFAVTEVAPQALRDLRVGDRLLELFGPSSPEPLADEPDRVERAQAGDAAASRAHRTFHLHLRRRHDGTRP
jgi:ABC-type transporter Mla MlaB component